MSWSNSWVGRPSKVAAAIESYSERLTGNSKVEYDEVKGSIATVVKATSDDNIVHVEASGHAHFVDGVRQYASCSLRVRNLGNGFIE